MQNGNTIKEQMDNKAIVRAHPQSIERQEVARHVYDIFSDKREERDRQQDLFRDRTLQQYMDTNKKRFIQFKRRPAHKKPWQSNLASSTPNEKLIGILSKLATKGVEAKARSLREFTVDEMLKEQACNHLLEQAARKNNDDFQIVLEMMDAAEKGIVIGMEDWSFGEQKVRDVEDLDPETGEMKIKERTIRRWNDVRSRLIQVEDFYPGNLYVRPGQIQDMDDCFYRQRMTKAEFNDTFSKYPDADLVMTQEGWGQNESEPFWRQSSDVGNDEVEVLFYFNQRTDEYVIIANEVWINPMGKDTVAPLPWNHKKLPFWAAVFEPFDTHFFYGRSFIDKLAAMADSNDALFDRMLDQMTLAVSRPIVTDAKTKSVMTRGFLQPDNIIVTDYTNGRPNVDVLPIPDIPSSSVTLFQLQQQMLEKASISAEVIGGATGRDKTATQASIEREGAMELVSLFLKMIEEGQRQKFTLRFANILQFYTMPTSSKGAEYRTVKLKKKRMSSGRIGNIFLTIKPRPNQQEVVQRAKQSPENVEILEITPKALREFEAEIEVKPQSSIKMTEGQRQVLEMNYQKVMLEMYPDLFDREYGFEQLNLTFQKDPNEARAAKPQLPAPGQEGQEGQQPQLQNVPQLPQIAPAL